MRFATLSVRSSIFIGLVTASLVVVVGGSAAEAGTSIQVAGHPGAGQSNRLKICNVKRDSKGRIERASLSNCKIKSINTPIPVSPGTYMLDYAAIITYADVASKEQKTVHLATITVPRVDGSYTFSAFSDLTNRAEQDKLLLNVWVWDQFDIDFGAGVIAKFDRLCAIGSRSDKRVAAACRAAHSGNYRNYDGTEVTFESDGSYSVLIMHFNRADDGTLSLDRDDTDFVNQGQVAVVGGGSDGDFISVFPGVYGIKYTDLSGQSFAAFGIRAQ